MLNENLSNRSNKEQYLIRNNFYEDVFADSDNIAYDNAR
jgi:hypothetical protein